MGNFLVCNQVETLLSLETTGDAPRQRVQNLPYNKFIYPKAKVASLPGLMRQTQPSMEMSIILYSPRLNIFAISFPIIKNNMIGLFKQDYFMFVFC